MRGETANLKESFANLGYGFGLAVVLIYLVLVALFRSLAEPLIILITVPLGLAGVAGALWLTGTTFNIQSFLGIIFMAGVAVSNGILIVEFVNIKYREEHMPLRDAIVEGTSFRLRPILMTSFAAMLALLPMAIGVGHGAEANVPLARAVIGGLLVSSLLSLFVVPCLYYSFNRRQKSRRNDGSPAAAIVAIAVFTMFWHGPADADEIRPIRLPDALVYAKEHYPEIAAAQSQLRAQDAAIESEQAALLPQIYAEAADSSGFSGSYAGLGLTGISGSAFRKGATGSVNVEQNIYDFGRTSSRIEAEKARRGEFEGQQRVLLADALKIASTHYVECQRAGRYREIYAKALESLTPLAAEIASYARTGQRTEVDLSLVEMRVQEVRAQQLSARRIEDIAVQRLNLSMGNAVRHRLKFTCKPDSMFSAPHRQRLDTLIESAKQNRPEVYELKAAEERATQEKEAATAQYLPRIVGTASVGHSQETVARVRNLDYAVGIAIKIPLFDGFRTDAEVSKAMAELERLSFKRAQADQQMYSRHGPNGSALRNSTI